MIWYENIKTNYLNCLILWRLGQRIRKFSEWLFSVLHVDLLQSRSFSGMIYKIKDMLLCRCMPKWKRSNMSITSSKKSPWFTLTVLGFCRVFVVFGIKLYPKIVQFGWYMYMPWLYFSLYYENVCFIWYVPNVREGKSGTASLASIFVHFIDF